MKNKIFITGLPHSGKTTLLATVIAALPNKIGFVTHELLEGGQRIGFDIETHTGIRAPLARIHSQSAFRVSRYGVSIDAFEALLPPLFSFEVDDVLYLDEVGQMELFSEKFKRLVRVYLDSSNLFVGTLSEVYSDDFTEEIKRRPDIELIELTPENRDSSLEKLQKIFTA